MNIYKKARYEAMVRLDKKLTIQRVSDVTGISTSTLHSWEMGKSYPKVSQIVLLQKLYQCPIEDLIPKEDGEEDV